MERQRSKRSYHHYEYPDSHSPSPPPRSKTRYDSSADAPPSHRRASRAGQRRRGHHHPTPPTPPPPPPPPLPSQQLTSSASASAAVSSPRFQDCSPPAASSITTFFRILCPDVKCGGVIGKSGSIVKAFRQDTGAWINVHQLVPGDEERIIETSDSRRREADGRPPEYSPAQEALLLIHERILEVELELACGNDGEGYGDRGRVTTRLVVPRTHVGCLLGKGGKIIEQMRVETRTHIRILPRDQYTPRCVSLSEEVVQVQYNEDNLLFKKSANAAITAMLLC